MMIASVLDYLKSDDELVTILNHTKPRPKITAYKPHDRNTYPYVVVNLMPFSMDILTGQYNAEIRIVTDDDLQVEQLTTKLIDLLHTGNQPPKQINNEMLFHSSYAGNGFLFDDEKNVFEIILNFNTIFKR